MSKIPWTDESWNPVVGCSKVSAGCKNCYAERMAARLTGMGKEDYHLTVTSMPVKKKFKMVWSGEVVCREKHLDKPLHWREPRRVFVCSMGDLFHKAVPNSFIFEVLRVIERCPQHTFQILTKRPERLARAIANPKILETGGPFPGTLSFCNFASWPLPNLWLGVTAENQEMADKRIPQLLEIPAAVRFVSIEPMLGPVDLRLIRKKPCSHPGCLNHRTHPCEGCGYQAGRLPLDWVIVGPENGPGKRPFDVKWAVDLARQCDGAGVPLFVKPSTWLKWPEGLKDRQEYPAEAQRR